MKTQLICLVAVACVAASCQHKPSSDEDAEMETAEAAATELYVDTIRLHAQTFHRQLICNGKLKAATKSALSFSDGGTVVAVRVRNGERVRQGQVIAESDKRERQQAIEQARKDLEKARVELADKLIGLGYDGIAANVPADVLDRAKVTSGYYSAQYALQTAQRQLEDCNLRAPFSGRVADLNSNPYQRMDKVCTLIDDSYFNVEYSIMEAELKNTHVGQEVVVTPFADSGVSAAGRVVNINPTVDEKGLIVVTARIPNSGNKLMDGMNVKVIAENNVADSFVVPKDAVVERDGYHVVFVYRDGEAVWTYVDIAYSNLTSHAITGCKEKETTLAEGDVVITSGNLNLADGTKVRAKERTEE